MKTGNAQHRMNGIVGRIAGTAALVLALLVLSPSSAKAAEPTPGAACSTLGEVVYTGGPGELGYFLSCNGSQYVSILGYATDGRSLIQIATDPTTCTSAITGRLRFNNDIMEMCNGSCWLAWGFSVCDTLPDPFLFTDLTMQTLSTLVTSNIVHINNVAGNVSVSISGALGSPQYRICDDASCAGGGDTAWTSAAGYMPNNSYLQLRITTAPTYDTPYNVGVTVGTGGDTWTVTTQNDNVPDAFTFTDLTMRPISQSHNSNIVQITGISGNVPVSISGGGAQFRICNDSACTGGGDTAFGTSFNITNGAYLQLQMTSSGSYDTAVATTVTVGTLSDTWSITTQNDDVPNAFTFTDITGVNPGVLTNHAGPPAAVQITGITGSVTTSVSGGGEYRLCDTNTCGGTVYQNWTAANSSIQNGWFVQLRATSATFSGTVNTVFTVGTGSDTWSVTTRAAYSCTSEPAFGTVAHNGTIYGYTASTANDCTAGGVRITRTCYDGTLNNPSYNLATCNNNCNGASNGVAWVPGGWVAHTASITAYPSATNNNCAGSAVTRTCTNGTLSNAGNNIQTCNNNCDGSAYGVAWAGWITHGSSVDAYSTNSVPCGSSCPAVVSRTCTNGTLSNAGNNYQNCTPVAPAATTFSVTPTSFIYTGGSLGPTITPSPGGATWSVSAGTATASAVGSYNVTATATGCFTGTSGSVGWVINPSTCANSGGCTAGPYANGATCTTYSSGDDNNCPGLQRTSTCTNGSWDQAPYAYGSCQDSCMNAFNFPTTNNAPIGGWVESGYGQATGWTGGGCGFGGPAGAEARVCSGPGTGCGAWEVVNAPGYGPDGMGNGDYAQFRYIPGSYSSTYNFNFGCGGCGFGGSWTLNTQAAPAADCWTGACGTVAHNGTCTSYSTNSSSNCGSVQRVSTCNNGNWDQAPHAHASCSAPPQYTLTIYPTYPMSSVYMSPPGSGGGYSSTFDAGTSVQVCAQSSDGPCSFVQWSGPGIWDTNLCTYVTMNSNIGLNLDQNCW